MSLFHPHSRWLWFLVFALAFSTQVVPRIFSDSPSNDEPMDIADGYFGWKGDLVSNGTHPPFLKMLQTLPLQFMSVQPLAPIDMGLDQVQPADALAMVLGSGGQKFKDFLVFNERQCQARSYQFKYGANKVRFGVLLAACRSITFCFALGIGLLIFLSTRSSNALLCLSALALWAFEPTLSAFSSQCGSDVPAAFFFFAAILAFQKNLEGRGPLWKWVAGLALGAAIGSKFSMLYLLPILLSLEIFDFFRSQHTENKDRWLKKIGGGLIILGTGLVFLLLTYLPGTLQENHHWAPWTYLGLGLAATWTIPSVHHPTYFCGIASDANHWAYFPLAFLLKSTLPFILCLIVSLLRKGTQRSLWLWVPCLVFFALMLPVQNLGVRYLLPIYPLLILIAAEGIGELWTWEWRGAGRLGKALVLCLLFWHAASSLASEPAMIGYFNDLVPWKKKVYYLGDSNLDMGQDIKRLADTAREKGWTNIKVAQLGGAVEPSFYGTHYSYWTQKDIGGPQPGTVYLANVFLFQMGPLFDPSLLPIARGWMTHIAPSGMIGGTWVYYEIPGAVSQDLSPVVQSVHIF